MLLAYLHHDYVTSDVCHVCDDVSQCFGLRGIIFTKYLRCFGYSDRYGVCVCVCVCVCVRVGTVTFNLRTMRYLEC